MLLVQDVGCGAGHACLFASAVASAAIHPITVPTWWPTSVPILASVLSAVTSAAMPSLRRETLYCICGAILVTTACVVTSARKPSPRGLHWTDTLKVMATC